MKTIKRSDGTYTVPNSLILEEGIISYAYMNILLYQWKKSWQIFQILECNYMYDC